MCLRAIIVTINERVIAAGAVHQQGSWVNAVSGCRMSVAFVRGPWKVLHNTAANKPGWSHAWVLHGPEGSAVVSLNNNASM